MSLLATPLIAEDGGIINDPVLLRLGENHFWLAVADSDVLLWARGVARHAGMRVQIQEPDVSPLQVQGPRSREVLRDLFGSRVLDLAYYHFFEAALDTIPVVVTRTGWTGEIGYEIYLRDGARGVELWDGVVIGTVTSAVYSPRLKHNIGYAMVPIAEAGLGTRLTVETPLGSAPASVVEMPFVDPKKTIPRS